MKINGEVAKNSWLSNLNNQIDFYLKSDCKKRVDDDFDWEWIAEKKGLVEIGRKIATNIGQRIGFYKCPEWSQGMDKFKFEVNIGVKKSFS